MHRILLPLIPLTRKKAEHRHYKIQGLRSNRRGSNIRKEVTQLSTKMQNFNVGHLQKALRALCYLKTTLSLGPTYFTEKGVVFYRWVDVADGMHESGRSQEEI